MLKFIKILDLYYILVYLYCIIKTLKHMKTLETMSQVEKRNHLNNILSKIKSNYIIEDVTPKGYGPEEN